MNILGYDVQITKRVQQLSPLDTRGGWLSVVREPYAGAWQRNVELDLTSVESNPTVFACKTLIASDMAKMWLRLVQLTADGIWEETSSAAFSPFLRKPNRYQNRLQFVMQWMLSKLSFGNTYALKERDARGVVVAAYILSPPTVTPLVTEDGAIYYQLQKNDLAGLTEEGVTVPASEIMHDTMYTPSHPKVGVSPIFAAAMPAIQGLRIQENSTQLFTNGSNPGGVLLAPGPISDETAARLKAYWDANYTGTNVGKVAVLGDNLKYQPMVQNAVDAQLIEQLRWSDEAICRCFHVPAFKVGVGQAPAYNGSEALDLRYYSDCLQVLIEAFEATIDEGIGLGPAYGNTYGSELDRDDLFLMDTPARVKAAGDGIGSGAMSPDEARRRYLNLGTSPGGNTQYLQQQNYSLSALAERDREQPFAKPAETPAPVAPAPDTEAEDDDMTERFLVSYRIKALEAGLHAA